MFKRLLAALGLALIIGVLVAPAAGATGRTSYKTPVSSEVDCSWWGKDGALHVSYYVYRDVSITADTSNAVTGATVSATLTTWTQNKYGAPVATTRTLTGVTDDWGYVEFSVAVPARTTSLTLDVTNVTPSIYTYNQNDDDVFNWSPSEL
jgi:hypothetical protein